ncbi:radical SAM protein [candidate division WOR-3 bacterium]|nr:radical SAM protein [candidate division WOR-3 bacterium]
MKKGSLGETTAELERILEKCELCPRKCGVNRLKGEKGFCRSGNKALISSYGPHFGEEPFISGKNGSGTVFFANCTMRCVYCQNYQISQNYSDSASRSVDVSLAEIMLSLQHTGCENINLVTPTHYLPQISASILTAAEKGLILPLVYNCGGYENPDVIKLLEGIIDIYMPDVKYYDESLAQKYSGAPFYFENAIKSLEVMIEQTGNFTAGKNGKGARGVVLRHLVLPGNSSDSKNILSSVKEIIGVNICLSIMSQYYPCNVAGLYPELNRTLGKDEYSEVVDFACDLGFDNVFAQDLNESPYIYKPDFRKDKPFET